MRSTYLIQILGYSRTIYVFNVQEHSLHYRVANFYIGEKFHNTIIHCLMNNDVKMYVIKSCGSVIKSKLIYLHALPPGSICKALEEIFLWVSHIVSYTSSS